MKPRLFLVLAIAAASATRAVASLCDPPPSVVAALRTLPGDTAERRKALAELAKRNPDDFWWNRLFLDGPVYQRSSVREQYRQRFAANPSIENQYLYARSLVGFDTKQALQLYSEILKQNPDYPWVHYSQLEIYRSEVFRDRAKLAASFDAVVRACPVWVGPYSYLSALDDATLAPHAARLRPLLEASQDRHDLASYTFLWAAEFRPRQPDEKQRVAADIARLRQAGGLNATVAAGARLIGDTALAAEMTPPLPFDFIGAPQAWEKEHPYPKPDDPEGKRAYAQALLAVSADWIAKAPERITGYSARLRALQLLDAPVDELATAAEDEVRAARIDDRAMGPSFILGVARLYVTKGIQLDRAPALLGEALSAIDDPDGVIDIDLVRDRQVPLMNRMERSWMHVSAVITLSECYQKQGEMEKARATLAPLPQYLGGLSVPPDTRDEGLGHNLLVSRARASYDYWNRIAALDELESKKEDALQDYRRALLAYNFRRDDLLVKQRRLWKELARSDEAWQEWIDSIPIPAWEGRGQSSSIEFTPVQRALPKTTLRDLNGAEWPADRFGKTTIAVVWATWCQPCVNELPYFAKLAQRLKDRPDVQVVSFNTDDNPETARQFMRRNGYDFPVVLAKNFAEDLMPYFSIPRTWVIRNGAIAMESVGFGNDGDRWIDRIAGVVK